MLSHFFFSSSSEQRQSAARRVAAGGTVPGPRESHTLTIVGSRAYVFGGFDGSRVLNDLYAYDLHSGMWSQLVHTGVSPPSPLSPPVGSRVSPHRPYVS